MVTISENYLEYWYSNFLTKNYSKNLLTKKEEYELIIIYQKYMNSDLIEDKRKAEKVLKELICAFTQFITKIAIKFKGYKIPLADLISEGIIGFIEAVKKFEIEKDFRLSTYSQWYIRSRIQEYCLKNYRLVRLGNTKNQKKLFFNLNKTKTKLGIHTMNLNSKEIEMLATYLCVSDQDIIAANISIFNGKELSLNTPINGMDDSTEIIDGLIDINANIAENNVQQLDISNSQNKALQFALSKLDERDRKVFEARKLREIPLTLEEIATQLDRSRERVRQIEERAFYKVKCYITEYMKKNRLTIEDLI